MNIEDRPETCPNCGSGLLDSDEYDVDDISIWCDDCGWAAEAAAEDVTVVVEKWTTTEPGDPSKRKDRPDPGPLLPGFA